MLPSNDPILALLSVVQRWTPDLAERHRVHPNEIPGFVPPPLRKIYQFAGNYPVPFGEQRRSPSWIYGRFGAQDQLLPPSQLELKGDRFRFVHENQGVWWCETLANESDPPVYELIAADADVRVLHSRLS